MTPPRASRQNALDRQEVEDGRTQARRERSRGASREIFPFEMTTAQVTCANCGSLWRVGQAMVYRHDMGTIVRCASCDNALIRVGRGRGRYLLDMRV